VSATVVVVVSKTVVVVSATVLVVLSAPHDMNMINVKTENFFIF